MLTLRDIMTTEIETVHPGDSLRDAADLFSAEHITGAPVLQGEKVVGVLSVTDLLEFQADGPTFATSGTGQAEWGDPDSAEMRIWSGEDAPATYFTDYWADAGMDVADRMGREEQAVERDLLADHTVAEAMTRGLFALGPDTPVEEAAAYLLEKDVHRVLVIEDEVLLGVVTTTDLVRAVAEQGLEGD